MITKTPTARTIEEARALSTLLHSALHCGASSDDIIVALVNENNTLRDVMLKATMNAAYPTMVISGDKLQLDPIKAGPPPDVTPPGHRPQDLDIGDYVLATKYSDGSPKDHFVVGYFFGPTAAHYKPMRYDVRDGEGNNFRGNGFRRVEKIDAKLGKWICDNLEEIDGSEESVWSIIGREPIN